MRLLEVDLKPQNYICTLATASGPLLENALLKVFATDHAATTVRFQKFGPFVVDYWFVVVPYGNYGPPLNTFTTFSDGLQICASKSLDF